VVAREYAYWNEKEHTPDHLYENLTEAAFQDLLAAFEIPENTRGLELGCGDGPFARRLKNKRLDLYGVDISFALLRLCENMLPVQANALKLPFTSQFFDWIIYAFALHHVPDTHKALQEASRVLKNQGKIFIIDPNYAHPIRFLTRKPGTFLRKRVFTHLSPEERWAPLSRIKKILRDNDVAVQTIAFFTPEFHSSSVAGKIQKIVGNFLNFAPFNRVTQSYYLVIGTKQGMEGHHGRT
jgi:SAM-dependent methyltransferase